jgi:hypothetical protein
VRDAGGGDGSSSGGKWAVGSGEVVAVQQQWAVAADTVRYVCMQRAGGCIWAQDQDPREQHLDNKWTRPWRPFWMASVTTGSTPVAINASCCPLQARSSHPCRPELAR